MSDLPPHLRSIEAVLASSRVSPKDYVMNGYVHSFAHMSMKNMHTFLKKWVKHSLQSACLKCRGEEEP